MQPKNFKGNEAKHRELGYDYYLYRSSKTRQQNKEGMGTLYF
jgi:hypothetical protein